MKGKKGLVGIVSEKLEKIKNNFSLVFEVIPVATRTTVKKVISKVYSYDRNGIEIDNVTVNEKKYKLFLVNKNGGITKLKSGTEESVKKYCNYLLKLISKYNAGNTDELNEFLFEKSGIKTGNSKEKLKPIMHYPFATKIGYPERINNEVKSSPHSKRLEFSKEKIFTIGYSSHSIDEFIANLKKNKINVIVDIRVNPSSKDADQFNKENLQLILKQNDIKYVFMGDQLGAEHNGNDILFENGHVFYRTYIRTIPFNNGMKRIFEGINKGYKIAIMCTEKNPLECHRYSLISSKITEKGINVIHIHNDKNIEHKLLERKFSEYLKNKRRMNFDIEKILNFNEINSTLLRHEKKEG
jgi:hypothetical protein